MIRALGMGLGLLSAAGAAAGGGEVVLPPIQRVTLENGLRLVVAEHHEVPLVEFYAIVGAGAAQDPPGCEGVAALTAGTLGRGAGERSAEALAEAIESLGGALAARAGTDGSIVSGEFLAEDFGAGLDLLRDVLRRPVFARDEIRRARDEQVAAIVAALEDPQAVADDCFMAWVYGTHPYGRPVEGRRDTVPELGRGNVRDFYDRWYRPNATILVVVGDVAAAEAIALVRAAFGDWAPRADAAATRTPVPPPVAGRRVLLVDMPSATQTQLRLGAPALARRDPDWLAAQVANTLLGGGFTSLLIEELRVKRSLTYDASSWFNGRLTGGEFQIDTFTKTPTTVETLRLAMAISDGFRGRRPEPRALAKAQAYLRGQYPLGLETAGALASRLAEIELHGLPQDDLTTYRGRVAAVTPEVAARVTAEHLPPSEDMAVVIVGQAAELRESLVAAFGPVRVVAPDACDRLTATAGGP